jgi:ferritin-like metal-binding protein YciE
MSHEELYMSWLNDAYGMELSLVEVLERRIDDAEEHPHVRSKIQQHLDETRRHAELVKSRIENRGGDVSSVKSGLSKITGMIEGMGTKVAKDNMVKNGLADYSMEHFEIASYKALMTAAQEMGDSQTADVCRQIIRDEESMAKFLEEHLPMTVQETLQHEASAHD